MNKARSIPILLLLAFLLSIIFTGCRKQSAEETVAAPVPTSAEAESTFIPEDDGEEPEATEEIETVPTSTIDPSALAAVIVGGDSAGTGKPFTFDATQSQPGATSIVAYEWDMGDGTFLFGLTVDHVYMEAGSYTVTLAIIDEDGEQSSTSKVVEVEDLVDDILPTEEAEFALAGTTWVMDNAIRGTTITLEFGQETVSGSSGCNSYNANYSIMVAASPPTSIDITVLSSTSKSCTLEVMAQEQGYLESLDSAESYTIEGTKLILETGSGTLTFSMMSN
jgi:heat shock protein HslJ